MIEGREGDGRKYWKLENVHRDELRHQTLHSDICCKESRLSQCKAITSITTSPNTFLDKDLSQVERLAKNAVASAVRTSSPATFFNPCISPPSTPEMPHTDIYLHMLNSYC